MKLFTANEMLFSAKSFASAMLALYIALSVGLPHPFWTIMTAYIVSAPYTGPTRSKAVYRFMGTLLGACASIIFVQLFIDSPELMSLVMALWVGFCLYVSLLDRTPRAYVMMLAGYSAGLIAFPAINNPAGIFDVALARVEEILLGITCATLVHSLILPQGFGPVMLARLDRALRDAQTWIGDALVPAGNKNGLRDRRKLAADITELRMMAFHLPFDTSNMRWTANAIHTLQERLSAMLPLLSAIEDRIVALREMGALDESSRWATLLADIRAWTGTRRGETPPTNAPALYAEIAALTPADHADASWFELLQINLGTRLRDLVELCEQVHKLHVDIANGATGDLPQAVRYQPTVKPKALHLDHGIAMISGVAAGIASLAGCAFWIATGWPSGASVPMMASILACFFATQDDPVPFIKGFLIWTVLAVPVSAFYLLVVIPGAHSFEMLALACAPFFLLMGAGIGRPSTYGMAMPALFSIGATLALQDTNSAELASFLNGTLSQILGVALAVLVVGLFRTVGANWTAKRLLRAGWGELARIGDGRHVPSVSEFSSRMVDRIAMLTPRLSLAGAERDLVAIDTVVDLRTGLNMTRLLAARNELGRSQAALWALMEHLAQHFSLRPQVDNREDERLLVSIDNALRSVSAAVASQARSAALTALAGIRRDMFPKAAPYQPMPILEKEIR